MFYALKTCPFLPMNEYNYQSLAPHTQNVYPDSFPATCYLRVHHQITVISFVLIGDACQSSVPLLIPNLSRTALVESAVHETSFRSRCVSAAHSRVDRASTIALPHPFSESHPHTHITGERTWSNSTRYALADAGSMDGGWLEKGPED